MVGLSKPSDVGPWLIERLGGMVRHLKHLRWKGKTCNECN
jgi:hypothetical protein